MKHRTGIAVVLACVLGTTTAAMGQPVAPGLHHAPSALLAVDQNRATVIDQIVTRWGAPLERSGAGLDAGQLRAMLSALRADHLLAASLAGTLDGLRNALVNAETSSLSVDDGLVHRKAIGDPAADLSYTPIVPCRIADTRFGGGPLAANVQRQFDGYNATSFGFQGGSGSNCGMPNGVAAIAMNVYAVNPTNLGFIKVWPANAAEPAVSTVNYQPGQVAVSTGAIVPVDGANSNRFLAKSPSVVDFIVDVVGYFNAPTAPIPQLSAAVTDLQTRMAKLEGQITAADLAGTYRFTAIQMELDGGAGNTSVSSYVFHATVQFAANGTYTYTPTSGEDGNALRFFTVPPSVVPFVGSGVSSGAGTWTYAAGAITVDSGLVLDVGAGGRVLVGTAFGHSDGTTNIIVITRL
jgi:hypothetical protein